MNESTPRDGSVLAGRYRLTVQLGCGGMGSVWRADDLTLGSPVAIKLIDPALAQDAELRARFHHEARAAAALRSPHVVQVFDHGIHEGVPFIAMELLDGESLAARLERVRILPHEQTARTMTDVARAIRKAHEAGIIHRDLKPDNVFLVPNDDQEIAKVLDFGIAKTMGAGAQKSGTRTGTMMGTPPYMSPEQIQGKAVDFRADLWSLAIIAFECVCGRVPFPSDTTGELVLQICAYPIPVPSEIASVPPGFDAWFARGASRDPEQRFQSARELSETLRAVLVPGRWSVPEDPSSIRPEAGSQRAASPPVSSGSSPSSPDVREAPGVTGPRYATTGNGTSLETPGTLPGPTRASRTGVIVAVVAIGIAAIAGAALWGLSAGRSEGTRVTSSDPPPPIPSAVGAAPGAAGATSAQAATPPPIVEPAAEPLPSAAPGLSAVTKPGDKPKARPALPSIPTASPAAIPSSKEDRIGF